VVLTDLWYIYILIIYTILTEVVIVKTAKLFKNGDSQAVRLPKEFRFAGAEVLIKRVGSAVVLLPKAKSWDTLVQSLDKFPADFMSDREQPREAERRESLP
jgi:antitoxin VapB